jgi:hypothetical protein
VIVLVIVLLVTNILTAIALVWRSRSTTPPTDSVEIFEAPRPPTVGERGRRLITIEILNPIELASARGGRFAGLAGSLVPGVTRRIVYEQTYKTLRRELDRMAVHADVRLHTLKSVARPEPMPPSRSPAIDAVVVDEVAPLDLGDTP